MNFSFFGKGKGKSDLLDNKQTLNSHGKDIWTLLHTSAIYLPDKLSEEDSKDFKNYVEGVLYFSTKFDKKWLNNTKEFVLNNPLNFQSREDASVWLCHFHNHINLLTEKDLFECKVSRIAKRWGNYSQIQQNEKVKDKQKEI